MEKQKKIPIKVRVVFRKGSALVVERMVGTTPERVTVTEDSLSYLPDSEEARISEENFEMGIPYGIPFESRLSSVTISPDEFSFHLHQLGIWTVQDIVKNPKLVQDAVLSSCKEVFFELNALIREVKE